MNDSPPFDPGSIDAFRVTEWRVDRGSRILRLRYAFDDRYAFEEIVEFVTPPAGPGSSPFLDPADDRVSRAIGHLHVAAGVSYYKAAAPRRVVVESLGLGAEEVRTHQLLYDQGLREFAVANGLSVPVDVHLESAGIAPAPPPASGSILAPGQAPGPGLWHRPIVPVGGGKDSMVLIDALAPLDPLLLAVNPRPLINDLAAIAHCDLVVVNRRIDSRLLALNDQGALNGHVPVTAIISLIAVVGALLYGSDTVAMAIERSASEETSTVGGVPVNHQFSKSLEFERALASLITTSIDPGLRYGSALRPYSELVIAGAFARLDQYHRDFVSCNAVFRMGAPDGTRWCGHCPKCRFVALMLAPFLDRARLAAVMGADLFDDPAQIAGFAELISDSEKPYECVGERRESAVALSALADDPAWRTSAVVAALGAAAAAMVSPSDQAELWAPDGSLAHPDPEVAACVRASLDRPVTGHVHR